MTEYTSTLFCFIKTHVNKKAKKITIPTIKKTTLSDL